MAAAGGAAAYEKPVWMTELGWSTSTSTGGRGQWAGQKPAGVSEEAQAANLSMAYHCLAAYQSVEVAMWFTLRDLTTGNDELDNYGPLRRDGSHKASWDAFHSVATRGDTPTEPCGDFDPPAVAITSPSTASVAGRVVKTGQLGLAGKVRVFWQRRTKGRWNTIHGGLKPADKRFRFTQRLARPGTWRVRIRYLGVAPYKGSTVVSRPFRAR